MVLGCKAGKDNNNENLALFLWWATSSASSATSNYGGTDPKGDFVTVDIDRMAKTITHTNHTVPSRSGGLLSYIDLAKTDSQANGFSMIRKVTLATGGYALFAEFPGVALAYQQFTASGIMDGDPQYVVLRSETPPSHYYERAFVWMKFFIDTTAANSDMESGFAAWDSTAGNGRLYGAGYSNNRDVSNSGPNTYGISNVNEAGTVGVPGLTYDSSTQSNTIWDSAHPNDRNYAITLVGTASGAAVMDFGPNMGGGGGLAIPQAGTKAFQSAYTGTYFVIVYEYAKSGGTRSVQLVKTVFGADGSIRTYNYTDHTATATPFFSQSLTAIEDIAAGSSPNNPELLTTSFRTISGNAGAASSVTQNAHLCHGSFVAAGTNQVAMIAFEEQGRYLGFTMFENGGTPDVTSDDVVRFGFGIKDSDYSDSF
jgi:hypothetical protein